MCSTKRQDKHHVRFMQRAHERTDKRAREARIVELEKMLQEHGQLEDQLKSLESGGKLQGSAQKKEEEDDDDDGDRDLDESETQLSGKRPLQQVVVGGRGKLQRLRLALEEVEALSATLRTDNSKLEREISIKSNEKLLLSTELNILRPLQTEVEGLVMEVESRDRVLKSKLGELKSAKESGYQRLPEDNSNAEIEELEQKSKETKEALKREKAEIQTLTKLLATSKTTSQPKSKSASENGHNTGG
ncbi:hypothetical protein T439DRAFT_323631 [Meredithblackwellia eburnea MCA 4105]